MLKGSNLFPTARETALVASSMLEHRLTLPLSFISSSRQAQAFLKAFAADCQTLLGNSTFSGVETSTPRAHDSQSDKTILFPRLALSLATPLWTRSTRAPVYMPESDAILPRHSAWPCRPLHRWPVKHSMMPTSFVTIRHGLRIRFPPAHNPSAHPSIQMDEAPLELRISTPTCLPHMSLLLGHSHAHLQPRSSPNLTRLLHRFANSS
eukprot:6491751-Amphidinium_carterae.1